MERKWGEEEKGKGRGRGRGRGYLSELHGSQHVIKRCELEEVIEWA